MIVSLSATSSRQRSLAAPPSARSRSSIPGNAAGSTDSISTCGATGPRLGRIIAGPRCVRMGRVYPGSLARRTRRLARTAETGQHGGMPARPRVAGVPGALLAAALALVGLVSSPIAGPLAPPEAAAAELALPAWTGGVELYRAGSFTTQRSWLWCTAAGVQIA